MDEFVGFLEGFVAPVGGVAPWSACGIGGVAVLEVAVGGCEEAVDLVGIRGWARRVADSAEGPFLGDSAGAELVKDAVHFDFAELDADGG